jgi:hypothetical protein
VAVLGTVLLSGYRGQLHLGGLPAAAAEVVRSSVAGGVAVADATHSAALLLMTRSAFVHGLDVMLAVCAVIAIISALLALVFLPRRASAAGMAPAAGTGPVAGTAPAAGTAPETAGRRDPAVPVGPAGPALDDRSAASVATGDQTGDNQSHERHGHH